MKIIKFLFITVCLMSCVSSKKIQESSNELNKYSYDLFGFTPVGRNRIKPTGGSCFFIRMNNRLFLVTAAHVITGCDDSLKIPSDYPKQFSVLDVDKKGNPDMLASINVSYLQKILKCHEYPDIAIIELNSTDSKLNKVNSVEPLIKPKFKKADNVCIVGFPNEKKPETQLESVIRSKKSLLIKSKNRFYGDSIAIGIEENPIYLDTLLNGFSGSPFLVHKKHSNEWRIAGVFTETVENTQLHKYAFGAMRIEQVIDSINALMNLKK